MSETRGVARRRLVQFHEAPTVLQFNRFIRSGYRSGYSYAAALRSIFELHNETGNIWSHLLPAIWIVYAFFTQAQCAETAFWMHLLHALPALSCLVASVSYHTCMACHQDYPYWIKLDVCGVYGLLVGSQIPIFAFALPCHPRLVSLMAGLYFMMGSLGLWMSLKAKSPLYRGLPMLVLMVIRLSVLSLRLTMGTPNIYAWKLYAIAELTSLLGGVINALRVPECWMQTLRPDGSPVELGPFDYWLNSHQLMHVFVVIAILAMRQGLTSDCQYMKQHELSCLTFKNVT